MAQQSDLQKEMETLRADLRQLQGDVSNLTTSLRDAGITKAEQTGEAARDSVEEQLAALRTALKDAKGQGASQIDHLQKELGDRPLSSVAVSFLIGFVVAKVLDRS